MVAAIRHLDPPMRENINIHFRDYNNRIAVKYTYKLARVLEEKQ